MLQPHPFIHHSITLKVYSFLYLANFHFLEAHQFQMLFALMRQLKVASPVVIYYEESEVILWKNFLDSEFGKHLRPPIFLHIDKSKAEYDLM